MLVTSSTDTNWSLEQVASKQIAQNSIRDELRTGSEASKIFYWSSASTPGKLGVYIKGGSTQDIEFNPRHYTDEQGLSRYVKIEVMTLVDSLEDLRTAPCFLTGDLPKLNSINYAA